MYTIHTMLAFSFICILNFALKLTLTSQKVFFCVFKTYIINMIQLVLIKIRFNIIMCFLIITYCLVFLQADIINCTVKNIIICLRTVKFLLFAGLCPWSLVGNFVAYLEPKSPNTLHSSDKCWGPWMIHVGLEFGPILWMV